MAQAAKINELVTGLIRSQTGGGVDDRFFKQLRDQAVKGLKNVGHGRTNQFDIQSKLEGLVEKFTVLNRDDLAEALEVRIKQLPEESKWTPEILSLLLLLSDRPLEKTKLGDVQALHQQATIEQRAVTWEEILADDPLDETDTWVDIERGYHSSGDDVSERDESDESTQATSVIEEDITALARAQLVPYDQDIDDTTRSFGRELLSTAHTTPISELLLVREMILMLHGLPTSVYRMDTASGRVWLGEHYALTTASTTTMHDLLSSLAELATELNTLRDWTRSEQRVLYVQSCQTSVLGLLMDFGSKLAAMEQLYLTPKLDTVVSIIDVRTEVEGLAKPLVTLSQLVKRSKVDMSPSTFLDALYDEACTAQLCGDTVLLLALADVLLAGLRTYLRPLTKWIQTGTPGEQNQASLVEEANPNCELGRLWRERFVMRTSPDGLPMLPRFMQAFVGRIFSLGKTRAFLEALNSTDGTSGSAMNDSPIECNSIRRSLEADTLLPFSQLLNEALDVWIVGTSRDCTPLLLSNLLHESGLAKTLSGLGAIFCSEDGRRFQEFAEVLFWRMDSGKCTWRDRFLLTELVQSTIGSAADVDSESLSVHLDTDSQGPDDASETSIAHLHGLTLEYTFSQAVQNVTYSRSSTTYSKTFSFLLQVHRAKYLLHGQFFDLRKFVHLPGILVIATTAALKLRQMLLTVVDILHAHITDTAHVLRASMLQKVETADSVDTMATIWEAHEKHMETSLLLASNLKPVREAVTNILELCERHAELWQEIHSKALAESRENGGYTEEYNETNLDNKAVSHTKSSDVYTSRNEADRVLAFLMAGLRSISRADGNAALEALVERLDWSVH